LLFPPTPKLGVSLHFFGFKKGGSKKRAKGGGGGAPFFLFFFYFFFGQFFFLYFSLFFKGPQREIFFPPKTPKAFLPRGFPFFSQTLKKVIFLGIRGIWAKLFGKINFNFEKKAHIGVSDFKKGLLFRCGGENIFFSRGIFSPHQLKAKREKPRFLFYRIFKKN